MVGHLINFNIQTSLDVCKNGKFSNGENLLFHKKTVQNESVITERVITILLYRSGTIDINLCFTFIIPSFYFAS